MKVILKRNELLDLQIACKKEYLLTNGKGGFCSSSVLDIHTRKYHGLLILPMEGTDRSYNYLSKIEVKVIANDKEFQLSTNKFPGVYAPTGHKYVDTFEMEYYPVTTYKIGSIVIQKSILMPRNEDSILVRYDLLETDQDLLFKATPLFAFRETHSMSKENMDIKPRAYFETNGFKFDPYKGLPPVYLQTSIASVFYPAPHWWHNFEYLKERNRGYEYQEDLFAPGIFEIVMKKGDSLIFRASLSRMNHKPEEEWDKEIDRISNYIKQFEQVKEPLRSFKIHGEHFNKIEKGKNKMLKAGYFWHENQVRDTLVSIPGLLLLRNETETAKDILLRLAGMEKKGLFPVKIRNNGPLEYKNIDISFLYFRAVQFMIEYGVPKKWITDNLLPVLIRIVNTTLKGEMPDVAIGDNGLLYAGNPSLNLTWMDGEEDGYPICDRSGAAVEINALWYNAVSMLAIDFEKDLSSELLSQIKEIRSHFESNFESNFWNENDGCLFDVDLGYGNKVNYIRPNQLFAIGLPYTCIRQETAQKILDRIDQHLVTTYGLRTLSPRNPRYKGEYKGDERLRNSAYQMGMVWPWFIGIYMDAMLKYSGSKTQVKSYFRNTFSELWNVHPGQYGLFHISELFRPNPPFVAKACIAHSMSEAEIIRVLETLKI